MQLSQYALEYLAVVFLWAIFLLLWLPTDGE